MLWRQAIVRLSTAVLTLIFMLWRHFRVQPPVRQVRWPLLGGSPPCVSNPFVGALAQPLEDTILAAVNWLDLELEGDLVLAQSGLFDAHDHGRFFPFKEMANCVSK